MDFLTNHIEALIFCSPKPIKVNELKDCLTEMFEADVPEKDIKDSIERLQKKYDPEEFSFGMEKSAS